MIELELVMTGLSVRPEGNISIDNSVVPRGWSQHKAARTSSSTAAIHPDHSVYSKITLSGGGPTEAMAYRRSRRHRRSYLRLLPYLSRSGWH